jgi:hypothetical protein
MEDYTNALTEEWRLEAIKAQQAKAEAILKEADNHEEQRLRLGALVERWLLAVERFESLRDNLAAILRDFSVSPKTHVAVVEQAHGALQTARATQAELFDFAEPLLEESHKTPEAMKKPQEAFLALSTRMEQRCAAMREAAKRIMASHIWLPGETEASAMVEPTRQTDEATEVSSDPHSESAPRKRTREEDWIALEWTRDIGEAPRVSQAARRGRPPLCDSSSASVRTPLQKAILLLMGMLSPEGSVDEAIAKEIRRLFVEVDVDYDADVVPAKLAGRWLTQRQASIAAWALLRWNSVEPGPQEEAAIRRSKLTAAALVVVSGEVIKKYVSKSRELAAGGGQTSPDLWFTRTLRRIIARGEVRQHIWWWFGYALMGEASVDLAIARDGGSVQKKAPRYQPRPGPNQDEYNSLIVLWDQVAASISPPLPRASPEEYRFLIPLTLGKSLDAQAEKVAQLKAEAGIRTPALRPSALAQMCIADAPSDGQTQQSPSL